MARRNFLACVILTFCLVSGQSPLYVLKGQKVTLKKDITGQPDNILWTHNGNKVVEFNGREERVYDPYKARVTLDWSSAELHISDLRLEDSGKYELEVFVNKKLEKSYHDVEILDRVAKPTISCKMNNSNNSGTLVCSAEPRQPVHLMKIEWHSQGNVHPGPHLQISLGNELDEQVYSCMVSNSLTTETAAFKAKDCNTTKSLSVALIVIIVIIVISLLLLCAGIYCYLKRKGYFPKRQTVVEKQKQYKTKGSGGSFETDETTPCIDEKSSSGKSSVRVTVKEMAKDYEKKHNPVSQQHQRPVPAPQKKKEYKRGSDKNKLPPSDDNSIQNHSDDKEKQDAGDPEQNGESADRSKDTSSVPRSSTASDASNQNSTDHQNTEAFPSSVTPPDAGQNKDDINDKNTTEGHLTEAPDKQEGHCSNKLGSSAESADVNQNTSSEQKSSTAPSSPDKVSDPSNNDKSDSDSEQSSKVPLGNASDPAAVGPVTGPDSEPESAASDQNSTDHQNVEASSSSVFPSDAGQNKDDINDKNTTVEDHLSEAPDKQEGHCSNKSESPAVSADVNQNTSSEQKSSTAPASPGSKKEAAEDEEASPNCNTTEELTSAEELSDMMSASRIQAE